MKFFDFHPKAMLEFWFLLHGKFSMTAQILDGQKLAKSIRQMLQTKIMHSREQGALIPGLAVILVGDDPASRVYVSHKEKACKEIGIHSTIMKLPAETTEQELVNIIHGLNQDPSIHGILVQQPLPKQINTNTIVESIDPHKDVDGFHPYTLGRLMQRRPLLRPCTPYGIIKLLQHYNIDMRGKNATIIGASNIVGRPMALELLIQGATVTVCHRFTKTLSQHLQQADIIVVAIGKTNIVQSEWLPDGAVIIDVGMNRNNNGELCGDIDYASASEKAAWITPVPGGVGPMTVAMLMYNTLCVSGLMTVEEQG